MYKKEPHIQLTSEINTDSAIIMGDPARIDAIAKLMADTKEWAFNREYKSIVGTYKGKNISYFYWYRCSIYSYLH